MVDKEVNDIFKDFKFEEGEEPSHNEIKKRRRKSLINRKLKSLKESLGKR